MRIAAIKRIAAILHAERMPTHTTTHKIKQAIVRAVGKKRSINLLLIKLFRKIVLRSRTDEAVVRLKNNLTAPRREKRKMRVEQIAAKIDLHQRNAAHPIGEFHLRPRRSRGRRNRRGRRQGVRDGGCRLLFRDREGDKVSHRFYFSIAHKSIFLGVRIRVWRAGQTT